MIPAFVTLLGLVISFLGLGMIVDADTAIEAIIGIIAFAVGLTMAFGIIKWDIKKDK